MNLMHHLTIWWWIPYGNPNQTFWVPRCRHSLRLRHLRPAAWCLGERSGEISGLPGTSWNIHSWHVHFQGRGVWYHLITMRYQDIWRFPFVPWCNSPFTDPRLLGSGVNESASVAGKVVQPCLGKLAIPWSSWEVHQARKHNVWTRGKKNPCYANHKQKNWNADMVRWAKHGECLARNCKLLFWQTQW